MSTPALLAAGGVLWRRAGGGAEDGLEVALVHRPRYDDWSLPKGKPEPGEHLLQTAAREVSEETGHGVVLGRPLPSTSYQVAAGTKVVRWWGARAHTGSFVPSREVDAMRWLPARAALRLLTHSHDHAPLLALLEPPPPSTTLLLVRHAHAGDRASWPGDDRFRPLNPAGHAQAARLATVLRVFSPERVLSVDRVRCVQTVEPLARDLTLPVELEPALSDEAWQEDPDRAVARLRALGQEGRPTVLCSQGGALPGVLALLAAQDGVAAARNGKIPSRKGSAWVLALRAGRLVAADYLPDLAPVLPP